MTKASFVIIDLEATGLSPTDRVVEIGLVHLDRDGHVERRWDTLIRPERTIPNTHAHGISTDDVAAAPTFGQVAAELVELLKGRIIVSHDVDFGLRFLVNEFSRLGVDLDFSINSLGTKELSQKYLPGGPSRLEDCLSAIGLEHPRPHVASADADATAQLFAHLLPMIGEDLRPVWPCHIPRRRFPDKVAMPCARDDVATTDPEGETVGIGRATTTLNHPDNSLGDHSGIFPWRSATAVDASSMQSIVREWIDRYPEHPLFQMSPVLSASLIPNLGEQRTEAMQFWVDRYPEPLTATVELLADIPGVDGFQLEEMVQRVVISALGSTDLDGDSLLSRQIDYDIAEPRTLLLPPELQTVWHWWILMGSTLDLTAAPEPVLAAMNVVDSLSEVAEVEQRLWGQVVSELSEFVAGDPRFRIIARDRFLGKATLDALGTTMGITRERVRQLEKPLRERARSVGPMVQMIRAALVQRFAPFTTIEEIYREYPQLKAPSPFEGHSLLSAITGLSGDFELDGRWWQTTGVDAQIAEQLTEASDDYGIVEPEELATRLGVGERLLMDRLRETGRYRIGFYEGRVLTAITNYGDRCLAVLHLAGEALTSQQIIERLPTGNARSLSNALSIDDRFIRSAHDTWSLREWGLEEFTTIAGHIGKRLDENGGSYPLASLLEEAESLRISQSSIRAFATSGEYIVADGMITKPEIPVENTALPEEVKGLYHRDGAWHLLLTVTFDHLRGSGMAIHKGILALFGVPFLGKVAVPSRLGDQIIGWGRTNGTCSTIRRFLDDMGAKEGDRIWLCFDPENGFDVRPATPRQSPEDSDPRAELLNLTGLDDCITGNMNAVQILNTAIGLEFGAPLRRTVARLRHRNEEHLIPLVSNLSQAWSPRLDR